MTWVFLTRIFHTVFLAGVLYHSTSAMAPDDNSTITNEEQEAFALAQISLRHSGNSSRNDELYRDLLNNSVKNHYYQLSNFLLNRIKEQYFNNQKFFKITNPSFFSAARVNNICFLKSLLAENPSIKTKSRALHCTAQHGHLESATLLLEQGASLEWRAKHGETGLSVSIKHDQEDVFKFFLTHVLDFESHTPRHFPDLLSWVVMLKNREKYLELLLQHGANPNIKTDLLTALLYASTHNFTKSIDILLRYHADPNLKTATSSNTALMFAARQGHLEAVQELLQGATSSVVANALLELRQKNNNFFARLPVELRTEIAKYRIVETNITLTDKNGKTALDIVHEKLAKESDKSKKNQYQTIITLLLDHAQRSKDKELECAS